MMNYAKFPFKKISRGSKVVLYGAGRVGKSMFEQNETNDYCVITGIVDSYPKTNIGWGG